MNNLTRSSIVAVCLAACVAGAISVTHDPITIGRSDFEYFTSTDAQGRYQLASTEVPEFSFGRLEAVIGADAATRFPNSRVELGSAKTEHGTLTITVAFFGPKRQTQAYLYRLVPAKHSWKISGRHRLWFMPPSQLARGLRV
jgi:hypothetical protein